MGAIMAWLVTACVYRGAVGGRLGRVDPGANNKFI
jgi:hypothetical protein